jgi:hypothetical protein
MSKVKIEKQTKSADENWDVMVEQSFSKFNPDRVLIQEKQIN